MKDSDIKEIMRCYDFGVATAGIGCLIVGFILGLMVCSGCESIEPCDPGEVQCTDDLLEACNSDGEWDVVEDCAAHEEPSGIPGMETCCDWEGEPACMMESWCDDD